MPVPPLPSTAHAAWVHLGAPAPFGPADVPPVDVAAALNHAGTWTGSRYRTGGGSTLALWELLATVAATDLAVARALEPTLDARAILAQAEADGHGPTLPDGVAPTSSWGAYAAEGPGVRVAATPGSATPDAATPDPWHLDGVKPWCSLAGALDAGLVTAHLPDGGRSLFAVDLRHPGVSVAHEGWASRGLAEIPSTPVTFAHVPATPVGPPGWYLERPGFWWGSLEVAACWYGGAVGVARRVLEAARTAPEAGAERLTGVVGILDERLGDARRALVEGAAAVEASAAGDLSASAGRLLAKRVRASVVAACEDVLRHAGEALGPAPLAHEEAHAKRVADLAIYLRQHHPWREQVSLGRALVAEGGAAW